MAPVPPTQRRDAAAAEPPPFDIGALSRRLARGDADGFREFHAAYFQRLCRYVLVIVAGDEAKMRDVVQETYRRMAKHVRAFEQEAVFWSWLTALARTAAIDEARKSRRYWAVLDRFRQEPAAAAPRDHDTRLVELLEQALTTLDAADRRLLEQKYFDRVPVRELARERGATEGAVESRLVRLRQKLKAALVAALKHEP